MLRKKIKGLKKALVLGLIGISSMTTILAKNNKIEASAHNAYIVTIAIDEANFRYVPTIVYEENSWIASNHREKDIGNFSKNNKKSINSSGFNTWNVPVISYGNDTDGSKNKSEDELKKEYSKRVAEGDGSAGLVFTFPPIHGNNVFTDKVHANGTDEVLANRYANYVVGGLNDAISYCISQSGSSNYSISTLKNFSAKLANKQDATLNGVTFTVTSGNPSKLLNGLKANDYVKVSAKKGGSNIGSITVPYRVKKGYRNSSERSGLSESYKEKCNSEDTEYLDWKYTVLQGNYNADVKVITYSSVSDITKPSALTISISELLGSALRGLRTLLGLYPMEDLMLNGGQRDNTYFYGIMPSSWMNSATLLHIVCQTIAWVLMTFSFVKLIFKRQLQTMNIGERVSLMEGFKNIILTAFLLGMFPLIFNALSRINYALVDVFAKSSAFSSYIETTQSINVGDIAGILINFAFFVLACYFNFFYVIRGVTVALLYSIAPLCIYSVSLGGKYTQVFSSFSKELVSNIFIQTFHAIIVAFFTSITSTSSMKTFELLVVFISFIPLTKFLRQNIMGLGSGISDTASTAVSLGGAAVGGAIGGAMGGASKSGFSKFNGSSVNDSMVDAGGMIRNKGAQMAYNSRQHFKDANSAGKDGVEKSSILKSDDNFNSFGGAKQVDLGLENGKNKPLSDSRKQLAKNVLGGTGKALASAGMAGMALGGASIGDRRLMEGAVRSSVAGVKGISNAGHGIAKSIKDMKSSSDSVYKMDDGNFADSYTGLSKMYDSGDEVVTMYDAHCDPKTGEGMKFNNEAISNSNHGKNMVEMYNAFRGTGDYAEGGDKASVRNEAIARYQNQGITGCSYNEKTGQLGVVQDKNMAQKKNYDFRNIGEITPFKPKPKNDNITTKPISSGVGPSNMNTKSQLDKFDNIEGKNA